MLLTHVNRLEDLKKNSHTLYTRVFGLYRYITFEVSRFKEKKIHLFSNKINSKSHKQLIITKN